MTTKDPLPNIDLHWHQTQQHGQDISDLKAGQARLEVGVASLGDRVQLGFSNIQASLSAVTQPKPPVSWVPIAVLVLSVTVALGGLLSFGFSLITNAMQRENDLRFSMVSDRLDLLDNFIVRAREERTEIDAQLSKIQDQIIVLREQSAASLVSRQAIGDYVKEIAADVHLAHPPGD